MVVALLQVSYKQLATTFCVFVDIIMIKSDIFKFIYSLMSFLQMLKYSVCAARQTQFKLSVIGVAVLTGGIITTPLLLCTCTMCTLLDHYVF